MLSVTQSTHSKELRVLCLGAHSDDIEIGCAGTILRWLKEFKSVDVTWVVLSANDERAVEARLSARALLRRAAKVRIILGDFQDALMPADFRRVKSFLNDVRRQCNVDVVLTHCLDDSHQDHRLIAEIAWQCWRNHLILEYEIPKYEGDMGRQNFYVPLSKAIAMRKVRHLLGYFGSQRAKDWFDAEVFIGLMRLRGIECHSYSGYAEAFSCRKIII